jgi:hypothetical protein
MYFTSHYKIDFDKVNTIEDIKRILKVLDLGFEPNHPNLKDIEDLVKLEEKQSFGSISLSSITQGK